MKELGTAEPNLVLTEQRNPLSEDLDARSSLELVELIIHEDRSVAAAVHEARASIATAIDWVSEGFLQGGRLLYVGAGTSGRLGVLDASECPPTFGVSPDQVQAIIAGGTRSLTRAVEGAEDDREAGAAEIRERHLKRRDVVVGITSGSTTPFVHGALSAARKVKARTVLLTCTPIPETSDVADLVISVPTGPEILTGSTRMKAGTATKMVLNMISTGAMVRTGRTYGNLMVDLSCSNRKLVARGIRIIRNVTRMDEADAKQLLQKAKGHVKVALAMAVLGVERSHAEQLLAENRGFLRRLFDWPHRKNPRIGAVFFDMDGTILQYELPTGFSTWAALGWACGIFREMESWVDQYLDKKLAYNDIWRACAERIKGRSFNEIHEVLFPASGTPPYSRGFTDCIRALRGHYSLGIVSSGISLVSEEVAKTMHLDFELSNRLGVSQGVFDGTFEVRVPFDHKLDIVREQAKKLGLDLSQICFIGDSPNDIPVLEAVGYPVAYNPKTRAVETAARGNVIGDFLQLPRLLERYQP